MLFQPASARISVASTCTTSPFAMPASTQADTVRRKIFRNRASPRRCGSGSSSNDPEAGRPRPQPMNQRIAMSACASRIRRRSCANPSRKPGPASGGPRPRDRSPDDRCSRISNRRPPRAASPDQEPGQCAPGRDRREPAAPEDRRRTAQAGRAAFASASRGLPNSRNNIRYHEPRNEGFFQQPHVSEQATPPLFVISHSCMRPRRTANQKEESMRLLKTPRIATARTTVGRGSIRRSRSV